MGRKLAQRVFFVVVLFIAGIYCLYLKFETMAQAQAIVKISEDFKEDESYALYREHVSPPTYKKIDVVLHRTYKKDWKILKELKELLKGDEHSRDVEFEEDFLRAYLISENYDIGKALTKILNFLGLREEHKYFFHNISFDFTQSPAYRFITTLPQRLEDGSVTILFKLGQWDPDLVPLEHLKIIMFLISIQQLRNPMTQAGGFRCIFDFENSGLRHLKYGTPYNLHLFEYVSFEVLPAKFVAYHLVNINAIGRLLVTLTRPFLPPFVEEIFYTHASLKELLNYYPLSMIPVEYGGYLSDYYMADWLRYANKEHGNFSTGGFKNIY